MIKTDSGRLSPKEVFYLGMYHAWTCGISPEEYRNSRLNDVRMIQLIHAELKDKQEHKQKVAQMIAQMRR